MDEIIIHSKGREKRWVHRSNNEIMGLYTYQPQEKTLTGNIYWGKVVKVQKGLSAAFVDIGQDKNGYIHEKDFPQNVEAYHSGLEGSSISQCVHEGQKIMVQVIKDAIGTKGPRLSAVIELKGEHLVYMPEGYYIAVSKKIDDESRKVLRRLGYEWKEPQEGMVIRTNASLADKDILSDELITLRNRFQSLQRLSKRVKAPSLLDEQHTFYEDLLEQMKKEEEGIIYIDDYESLSFIEISQRE